MSEQTGGAGGSSGNGLVRGVPGKRIEMNGILDLRGVPSEQVAGIESLSMNGLLLLDENNRDALAGVHTEINGSTMVADADLRVVMQPNMELTKAMVEAMPAGQKMLVVGIIYVHPEVPGALLAEKFDDLRLIGVLIASEAVQGALFGKLELMGVTVTLTGKTAAVVRQVGETTLDADYLERLQDDSEYLNVGETRIPADVPEDLVARKIKVYHNVGETTASGPIIALLKSRCATNMGEFISL